MPPTRRPLRALGSLQLGGYANNPTRVITELAFIADEQANARAEGGHSDVDAPLEVQFDEFMDGVNSRGKSTRTRQRKMTVEQAAAILLVTVQKGHVELTAKKDDPHAIDVIKILPGAKRILATFLPKLRGYGDIPYDQQYRGAIALAKRHFFPKGKAPTKKELMALLLQSYQDKKELEYCLQRQTRFQPTKTLGIQTSLETIDFSSYTETANDATVPCVYPADTNTVEIATQPPQNKVEPPNDDVGVDDGPLVASEKDLGLDSGVASEPGPAPPIACTPVAPRAFNPYMTPVSNPRHADHTAALLDASPIPAINSHIEHASADDGATDGGVEELLQVTATSQGRLNYYYNKFVAACQKMTFLEGEKEEMQREFDLTKRKLDETEKRLREANADRGKLKKWVNTLLGRVDSIYRQLGVLREMRTPEATDEEQWTVSDSESQDPDPN